jgi:hypothetical protein
MKNDIWDIVPRPKAKSVVSSKWLYKIKHTTYGNNEKFRVRFMARGFPQKEGLDCEETFAPVARETSIRAVMSLVSVMGWRMHQINVKTSFPNGIIEEEVYIEQSRGFEVNGKESHVCGFKKALYGLKQVLGAWYSRIDGYWQSMGFAKRKAKPKLYFIHLLALI